MQQGTTRKLGIGTVLLFATILLRTFLLKPSSPLERLALLPPTPAIRDTTNPFLAHEATDSVQFREQAHSDSMLVRVDSFSYWQAPSSSLFALERGWKYVTVYARFENIGSKPRQPINYECYLIDDQDSAHVQALGARREPQLELQDTLQRGMSREGWLTFAIRKQNHATAFRYEELLGGQKVKILLPAEANKLAAR